MPTVLVLISTYNGGKYLRELLDSLISQKNVAVSIFVRDDGSSDNTVDILEEYSSRIDLNYYVGSNLGYAFSFWELLNKASLQYDYYAFCDQDDVWFDDKLSRAIELISKFTGPALYTSDVVAVDNHYKVLNPSLFKVHGTLSFYDSLKKSIVPGCTFVFNKCLLEKAIVFDGYMESHDWALYSICAAFGSIVCDTEPHIFYRIHNENAIGKKTALESFFSKIRSFFKKSKHTRSRFAISFLTSYREVLSDNYRDYLELYSNYKKKRFQLAFNKNTKGFFYRLMIIFGRI